MERLSTYLVGAILFAAIAALLIYDPFDLRGESHSYESVEAIPVSGERNNWFAQRTTSPVVMYDYEEKMYKMWFVGIGILDRSAIGYATSADGVEWTAQTEPILTTQEGWEDGGFRSVYVVKDGNNYRMWYSAENYSSKQGRIGYATSPDGVRWSKAAANPVILSGGDGEWDSQSVSEPSVVRVGNQWRMWFAGANSEGISNIGYATSNDGIHWSKAPVNPVFAGQSEWSRFSVGSPFVSTQYDGELY
jgi:predicted GH43/DUF377 family glycosyl hydrolase